MTGRTQKILVVGATGNIGSVLVPRLAALGHTITGTSRRCTPGLLHLDLGQDARTWQLPDRIDVAYLLGAVMAMSACHADPAGTRLVNVTRTLELADRLTVAGAHLVYVSTNLVLSGETAHAPIDSPLAPQCIYAEQKAEVEQGLLEHRHSASVLRVTKIAEGIEPLLRNWMQDLKRGRAIYPFADLVCAPLPVATSIDALVAVGERRLRGLHQIGGDHDISYVEIARALARHLGVDPALVVALTSEQAGVTLLARPRHTTLDTATTEKLLGIPPTQSQAVVARLIERIVATGA